MFLQVAQIQHDTLARVSSTVDRFSRHRMNSLSDLRLRSAVATAHAKPFSPHRCRLGGEGRAEWSDVGKMRAVKSGEKPFQHVSSSEKYR